jgi:nitrate reductase (cytochrome), electron transfer subunit
MTWARGGLARGLGLAGALAAGGAALVALLFALDAAVSRRAPARPGPGPLPPPGAVAAAGHPIPAEALVFRTRPEGLAADPSAERRRIAHPRSLASFRARRAYPGAPPPVPHGLTNREALETRCNTCHERGGFSRRFAAYAPVTPHPELGDCQQCHLPAVEVVGLPFPPPGADGVCGQCHRLEAARLPYRPLDWPATEWPAVGSGSLPGAPPFIPHPLHLRENCVACHAGPGAVAEIRTDHPERASCRQCHLASEEPAAGIGVGEGIGSLAGGDR